MLLTKLSDHSNFSERETFVAEYVLEHGNSVCNMTIQELAKVTYSSPSTIMRLCKKFLLRGSLILKSNSVESSQTTNPFQRKVIIIFLSKRRFL